MIRIALPVFALILSADVAAAQTATSPEPRPQPEQRPAAPLAIDTPIQVLAADARARAVLDRELPGLTTHERYEQFKAMSLKTLKPLSGGMITDERLARVEAALQALNAPEA